MEPVVQQVIAEHSADPDLRYKEVPTPPPPKKQKVVKKVEYEVRDAGRQACEQAAY